MTATDHPTAAAILARILAEPGEDAHRLVYADWLEESGDPARAEFVRVQVELARCSVCNPNEGPAWDWACGHKPLRRRERDLLTRQSIGLWFAWPGCPAVRAQFTDPGRFAAYRVGPRAFAALFSRGFVSAVCCPLADWLHHGPAVVRAHPVECVALSDREPYHNAAGSWLWVPFGVATPAPRVTAALPLPVFSLLADDLDFLNRSSWRTYRTRQDAMTALSTAALAWAKSTPVRPA